MHTYMNSKDGITHSNGGDKDSVYFDWTAPSNGTGTIRFGYARSIVIIIILC